MIVELPLWKIICSVLASAMGGTLVGFTVGAILANSKFRELNQQYEPDKRIG